jgi:uncharacterized protein (DUF3084 family)
MSKHSNPLGDITAQGTAGDRIRKIADQLKQETSLQIKATSRILGAAAQISENHDRLIDEVVEMVEEDLEQQAQRQGVEAFTVEQLKRQFKKLEQAKVHFGVKANSWTILVDKLNQQMSSRSNPIEVSVSQRLDTIEDELKELRTDLTQALNMLTLILKKIS